jgi:hypothetical protein
MSSSKISRRLAGGALAGLVALAAGAGGAIAQSSGSDTTIAVSPRVLVAAPANSPVDFPGVGKVRSGKALPRGYAVAARDVRFVRGSQAASAAFRMSCPQGKTWRAGAASGDVHVAVLDRTVSKKRAVLVMASFDATQTAVGQTAAGTIYALCR